MTDLDAARKFGKEDAEKGWPFFPEAYTINCFSMRAYADGFLSVLPMNQTARRFMNAGQIDRHTSQAQLDRAESGEDFKWEDEPGRSEAQPCIQ